MISIEPLSKLDVIKDYVGHVCIPTLIKVFVTSYILCMCFKSLLSHELK